PEMKHESKGVPIAWVRWRLDACSEAPASYCAVAVGTSVDPTPPAQIRTCRIAAYGSYLGCLASKRRLGWGWRILALGIHLSTSGQNRSHVIRSRWLRRRSARYQRQITWARKLFRLSILPGTE